MKKLFVLLLAICLIVPMWSCKKDETTDPAQTQGGGTTQRPSGDSDRENAVSGLPDDLDFGNEIVNIAIRDRDDIAFEMDPEANTVDVLASAIAARNEAAQNALNVAIEMIRVPGNWSQREEFMTNIRQNANLGEADRYDLVMGPNYSLANLMVEGYFTNLYNVPYLDLGAEWWNGNFNDECSYAGKLYMTEGELMLTLIDSAFVMFFDTANLSAHAPTVDIYEIVRSGNWTLEELSAIAKDLHIDRNGDGVKDAGDTFGMVSPAFASGRDGFQTAFGITVTTKDLSTGRISLSFGDPATNERIVNIYDDFYDFIQESDGVFSTGNNDAARESCRTMFQGGQALFITELLNYAGTLRGLEREYGVIPLPKYDTMQVSYAVASEAVHSQLSVMAASPRKDAAGALAEMLCFLTYRDVTLEYYDTVKYRNQKTPEAVEMLDLVMSSITSNFGSQFAQLMASPYPSPIGETNDISSTLAGQVKRMQDLMDDLKWDIQELA